MSLPITSGTTSPLNSSTSGFTSPSTTTTTTDSTNSDTSKLKILEMELQIAQLKLKLAEAEREKALAELEVQKMKSAVNVTVSPSFNTSEKKENSTSELYQAQLKDIQKQEEGLDNVISDFEIKLSNLRAKMQQTPKQIVYGKDYYGAWVERSDSLQSSFDVCARDRFCEVRNNSTYETYLFEEKTLQKLLDSYVKKRDDLKKQREEVYAAIKKAPS